MILGLVLLLLMALISTASFTAYSRSPVILRWSLDRFFPTMKVEVGGIQWHQPFHVTLRDIRVSDPDTKKRFASIQEVRVLFDIRQWSAGGVESIELIHPVVTVSPDFLAAIRPASRAGEREGAAAKIWRVGRVHSAFGEIYLENLTEPALFLSGRFAFDWKEFGTGSDIASLIHGIDLWALTLSRNPDFSDSILAVDLLRAGFSLQGIMGEREIASLEVAGGNLKLARETLELTALKSSGDPVEAPEEVEPFRIGELKIENLTALFDGPVPGGVATSFSINTQLHEIPLGGLADAIGKEVQTIELSNIELLSPLDPMVRVVTLHSVFAYFTLEGLAMQRIQRLIILNPVLYLSEDLFIYMESMRAQQGVDEQGPAESSAPSWVIEALRIEFGSIVLGGERIGRVGLPLSFHSSANDVSLDNLASLRMNATLEVQPQSFDFPPLQLELEKLRGDLRFAYPPQENPDNLVNTLFLDGIRWRQYTARKLWLSATFERAGISADVGGEAYGGYVNGGISFTFGGGSRWVGWIAGTGIDLQKLTDVIAPQNFRLTGPANFTIEVDAAGSRIDRVKGALESKKAGVLTISKIDDFLANIPENWSLFKQTGTRAALEVLRDFRYTSAKADFWFVENQGKLTLRLPGEGGSRNLEIYLHADESPDGHWKKPTVSTSNP